MSSFLLGTVVSALHGSSITLIKSLQDKYQILPFCPALQMSTPPLRDLVMSPREQTWELWIWNGNAGSQSDSKPHGPTCVRQLLIGTDRLHMPMLDPVPGEHGEQAEAGPILMLPENVPSM